MEATLGPIDLLLLCTGNICRSPMAEALFRDRLAERGIDAHVHSAGLALEGEPASAHGAAVLGQWGLDLTEHRSRIATPGLIKGADLILGMAREHVRHAVVQAPDAWERCFTLKELVRRGEEIGPRPPGQPLSDWLASAHAGRTPSDLLGDDPADDVFDPIGSSRSVYDRVATELRDLVDRLCQLAFPPEDRHEP